MEMAGVICVEDYEVAGLVILAEDMVEFAGEMEIHVDGDGKEWPGAWEFERDEQFFQWIWYCPDVYI
nr:hypothetical protein Itr_chr05CG03430 [Ipomoea trifida]